MVGNIDETIATTVVIRRVPPIVKSTPPPLQSGQEESEFQLLAMAFTVRYKDASESKEVTGHLLEKIT